MLKWTRPRITSSSAIRVGLCFCGSMSIRGVAPRCNCLLRFAARMMRRYFESTSGTLPASSSFSANSVVVATRLLLLYIGADHFCRIELLDHFAHQVLLTHTSGAFRINNRSELRRGTLHLIVKNHVVKR